MKPSPAQLHQALLNFYRPLRTNGAKVKDALEHAKNSVKESRAMNPAQNIFTDKTRCDNTGRHWNGSPCPRQKV
jgi:hypothetical protein